MASPDPSPDRRIPDPGFPDDDGSASVELAQALSAWVADPSTYPEVLLALQQSRLLVPVVAMLGEVEYDAAGLAHDKTSDMATVLLQGADGRLALLAFTGMARCRRGTRQARPVPVATPLAARSALQDDAAALLIDVAGPNRFVVEGDDLRGLAEGWTLARVRALSPGFGPATGRRLASSVDRSVPPASAMRRRIRSSSGGQHDRLPPASIAAARTAQIVGSGPEGLGLRHGARSVTATYGIWMTLP